MKGKKLNIRQNSTHIEDRKESKIFSNAAQISKAAILKAQNAKLSIVVLEGDTIYRKDYLGHKLNELGTIVRSERIIQSKTFSI